MHNSLDPAGACSAARQSSNHTLETAPKNRTLEGCLPVKQGQSALRVTECRAQSAECRVSREAYLEKERVEQEAGEPTGAAAEPDGFVPPYEALEERAESGV